MSELSTPNLSNVAGTSGPNFPQGMNVAGAAIGTVITMTEFYDQVAEPTGVANGAVWWTGTTAYQYIAGGWLILTLLPPPPPFAGDRALFSFLAGVDYVSIPTPANAASFGTLTVARSESGACAGGGRGVIAGGRNSGGTVQNTIDYFTFATVGNATAFGSLPLVRTAMPGCSSGTIGVFWAGFGASGPVSTIYQLTIATAANATSFGSLATSVSGQMAAASNTTRGIGVSNDVASTAVQFITFATPSNATSSGSLSTGAKSSAGVASTSRAVFGGGSNGNESVAYAIMQYLTIDSLSTSVTFGNLTQNRTALGGSSNGSRGVFGGGRRPFPDSDTANIIDYITIATPGNATDFGDLTVAASGVCSCAGD